MKETNHHILREALDCLPRYQAPALIVNRIFQELNDLEADDQLKWEAQSLPEYSPPSMVWEQIEEEISGKADEVKAPKIRQLNFKNILAFAASFLVLIMAGNYFFNNNSVDTVAIVFSQEKSLLSDIAIDWNEDDGDIQEVVLAFSNSILVQNTLNSDDLLLEMDELNLAKKDALEILTRYGNDATIITQITQIEKERSTIVKKMVEMMLG